LKTARLQTLQCFSCGRALNPPKGAEKIVCKNCGEEFDLRGFSSMELELEDFDRLLLYTLRKKRLNPKKSIDS
jgi:LSD1 subclass zinc finger protein